MSGKKRVLLNSGLYTFSNLLIKAIGFLLLPIYTLFLTPEDYGVVNLITSFNSVATYIIAFSLYAAVVRFYTDYKDDEELLKTFYGTVIVFVFGSGIVFVTISFILKNYLIEWFFKGIDFYPAVVVGLLTLLFVCLHTVHQCILQGMQHGKKLTIINLTVFGLTVGFTIYFIAILKLGAVGVLLASLVINIGYFIYMLIDLRINNLIAVTFDYKTIKAALRYSIPLLPHNLSTHIASFAARIFINNKNSLSVVGLYSVANQFGNIIDTVQASVNAAFAPWFYDVLKNGGIKGRAEAVNLSKLLLLFYSYIYMGIGLFSQEVIMLMTTERYVMAWTVIPILVLAYSVKSLYYFYVNILFYYKEAAQKLFIATITGSLFDVILAFILVPYYGMYGAALAFLIAKIVVVSIVVIMSRQVEDVGYRVLDFLKVIIPSLVFMGIGLYFSFTEYILVFSWHNLLYKFAILLIYTVYLFVSNRKLINSVIESSGIRKIFGRE